MKSNRREVSLGMGVKECYSGEVISKPRQTLRVGHAEDLGEEGFVQREKGGKSPWAAR